MSTLHAPTENRRARAQRRFALPLLAASLLLHLVAYQWAEGHLSFPSLRQDNPDTVTAVMLPPPPAKPVLPPKTAEPPKPKVKRKRPPVTQPVPQPATTAPSSALTETLIESGEDTADIIAAAAAEAAFDIPATEPVETETIRYTVSPPPSATLEYEVEGLNKGQTWHATGVNKWLFSGSSYRITVEAGIRILFKIDLGYVKSEGVINDFGLAPVLYSEKKGRKSMTNTHFRHQERLISFSASEASYPYHDGAQDRASISWQLAAIGRGDSGQFAPGAEIDIFVAERRDAGMWRVQVIGEEEIDTPYGKLLTWHAVRLPRPGSYDERFDVWLAPQHEWYPVKIRWTYANGDYYDLSLSAILPATEN